MNSLNLHSAIAGIGRPMKVSKENIAGLVTAIEIFTDSDEATEWKGWQSKAEYVADQLRGIAGLYIEIEDDPSERQGPQPVLYFSDDFDGPSIADVKQQLESGDPRIFVGGGDRAEIDIVMVNVQDGEEVIIADRLREILNDEG